MILFTLLVIHEIFIKYYVQVDIKVAPGSHADEAAGKKA